MYKGGRKEREKEKGGGGRKGRKRAYGGITASWPLQMAFVHVSVCN